MKKAPKTHSYALEVKSIRTGEWIDAGRWVDARNEKSAERILRRSSASWMLERREWRLVDKGPTPATMFTLTVPLRLP